MGFDQPAHEREADAQAAGAGVRSISLHEQSEQSGQEIARDPSRAALDALTAYSLPVNVRELENTIERLTVLGRSQRIEVSDLPGALTDSRREVQQRLFADLASLDELQRRYLLHVLESVGFNRTRAAFLVA